MPSLQGFEPAAQDGISSTIPYKTLFFHFLDFAVSVSLTKFELILLSLHIHPDHVRFMISVSSLLLSEDMTLIFALILLLLQGFTEPFDDHHN